MLENRSFDHMLGYMKNPAIAKMAPTDFNYEDPVAQTGAVKVHKAKVTALGFDPAHEFPEVDEQINGPAGGAAPMGGFISSSRAPGGSDASHVMGCFEPDQIPVFTKLADEFAIFNYWYSPMPGPTWPNRFFAHASTAGGYTESPDRLDAVRGYTFKNGTIYDQLAGAGKSWRIYFGDLPQAIGISQLRSEILGGHFAYLPKFYQDVKAGKLPTYCFLEPKYDAFGHFIDGDSMHPQNDVGYGERLIKDVYEALRNSKYWPTMMLIVTFDEHGGFYDHVPPPAALPTGDDTRYASPTRPFAFDRYGVRVPTVVVSAYTDRQTVIGNKSDDPSSIFDHCSILATVQKRFGLRALSKRDAKANTLEAALTRAAPRDQDAPKKLPAVAAVKKPLRAARPGVRGVAPLAAEPLTKDQEAFLGIAMAIDRELSPAKRGVGVAATTAVARTPAQAGAYAAQVQTRLLARRGELGSARVVAKPVRRKQKAGRKRVTRRKKKR